MMFYTNKDTFVLSSADCMGNPIDSLEAIMAGNEAGAQGCVVDLDVTSDDIPVLCPSGGFTTAKGDTALLSENTFQEIRNAFSKLVTIGQVIELVKSCAAKICFNLKTSLAAGPAQIALKHAECLENAFFAGLTLGEASKLAARFPQLQLMADVLSAPQNEGALIRSAQEAGLFGLRIAPSVLTQSICEEVHRVGMFVATTECHDEEALHRLLDLEVNFIETSRPDVAYAMMPKPEEDPENAMQLPLM